MGDPHGAIVSDKILVVSKRGNLTPTFVICSAQESLHNELVTRLYFLESFYFFGGKI